MKDEFVRIENQIEFEHFLEVVDFLHDALLREAGIVSRGYVDVDGYMYGDVAPYDARLVFHSQSSECPCIEVICEEMEQFAVESGLSPEPSGIIENGHIEFYLAEGDFKERNKVTAKRMRYRVLGKDHLGEEPRTVLRITEYNGGETA